MKKPLILSRWLWWRPRASATRKTNRRVSRAATTATHAQASISLSNWWQRRAQRWEEWEWKWCYRWQRGGTYEEGRWWDDSIDDRREAQVVSVRRRVPTKNVSKSIVLQFILLTVHFSCRHSQWKGNIVDREKEKVKQEQQLSFMKKDSDKFS